MSREGGDRGYFRGSEFSRLLILAALLVIGWPLVIYYGFVSKPKPQPERRPVTAVPPLPPADRAAALVGVLDAGKNEAHPRTFRDDLPLAYLFKKLRDTPPETLSAEARRDVQPADLLLNPRRFRGLPIRIDGFAELVTVSDGQDTEIVPNGRIFEVWFQSSEHDQRKFPCCLWADSVPTTLPSGRDLHEPVVVEAFFYRLLSYPAGDTQRFAPVLVGRIAGHQPERREARAPRSRLWTFLPLVLLMGYLSLRMAFSLRKSLPRRAPGRSRLVQDEIEPEALGEWLNQPPEEPGSPLDSQGPAR